MKKDIDRIIEKAFPSGIGKKARTRLEKALEDVLGDREEDLKQKELMLRDRELRLKQSELLFMLYRDGCKKKSEHFARVFARFIEQNDQLISSAKSMLNHPELNDKGKTTSLIELATASKEEKERLTPIPDDFNPPIPEHIKERAKGFREKEPEKKLVEDGVIMLSRAGLKPVDLGDLGSESYSVAMEKGPFFYDCPKAEEIKPVKRDFSLKGSLSSTMCPKFPAIAIGSSGCDACAYFSGTHFRDKEEDRAYVNCNWDDKDQLDKEAEEKKGCQVYLADYGLRIWFDHLNRSFHCVEITLTLVDEEGFCGYLEKEWSILSYANLNDMGYLTGEFTGDLTYEEKKEFIELIEKAYKKFRLKRGI